MEKRILVADDDKDILYILEYILKDAGYKVYPYAVPYLLLETINIVHPDLILLDVMFGTADGREICKKIKETDDKTPVILISASHNLGETINKPGGPNDFIAKPFDIKHLLNKVELALAS